MDSKQKLWRLLGAGLLLVGVNALAQDEGGDMGSDGGGDSAPWFDPDLTISGFIRAEAAFRTTGEENPFNQRGNLFNDVGVRRQAGYPLGDGLIPGTGVVGDILGAVGLNDITLIRDIATRNTPKADNDFNLLHLRGQSDIEFKIASGITGLIRVRGIFDPAEYDEFDPRSINSNADGYLYGRPNYFEYDKYNSGGRQNRLELVGEDYMVDLPAAYIDFQYGPVLARIGNQQIAWGQALFFRVFDVPNGLDLRRHLILDFASEEYADERISSPGARLSWQFAESWEIEGYAQMFQPTVYPNPNTPYNVIPSQFTIHDSFADFKDDMNYGARLRGRFGDIGLSAIYSHRLNPDGVFRWTASNVNRDVPGIPGSGAIVGQTPLEVDPSGVWSADEWFTYAGMARLDGLEGLNSLIREFPASQLLLASEVSTVEEAKRELDLFFALAGGKLLNPLDILNPNAQGGGGFRGHIQRDYYREDVYGLGASYVLEAEPGSILDQLIVNLEVTYTPKRRFTDISLAQAPIEDDEYIGALVMEKYQRFSEDIPATYMVFQWMHRTKSDLFGRHLSGMGGTVNSTPTGVSGGWNGLVLALQQPFPNLIWRADFALLYDTRGGLFIQPAVRWKPTGAVTVEAFYNFTDGELSGNPNENVVSTIDFADELGLRVGYQF